MHLRPALHAVLGMLLLCLPCSLSAQAADLQPVAAGEHRFSSNGASLWYRIAGQRGGTPIVFLAGGPGGSSFEFARLAGPQLERRHLMVYFDQRGTGRSERPAAGGYSIAGLVDDIEMLRRHLGVPRIVLVAHSFGGILALEYAAAYPQETAAVILAGPAWDAVRSCTERVAHVRAVAPEAYRRLTANGMPGSAAVCVDIFRAIGGAAWEDYNNRSMFPRASSLRAQRAAAAESGTRNTGELSRALFAAGLLTYRFERFDRISAPSLVIAGDSDHAIGVATQRELARRLRSEILIYPNAGHWMFIDEPVRFARDVTSFLRRNRL